MTDTHQSFWDARASHKAKVSAALAEVKAVIAEGQAEGLYEDGITVQLQDVGLAVDHCMNLLKPPTPKAPPGEAVDPNLLPKV